MQMIQRLFFSSLLLPLFLIGEESRLHELPKGIEAWVTGPLITPSASVVQKGHWNAEPYLYATFNTDVYNHHWDAKNIETLFSLSSQTTIQVGVTDWMSFQVTPLFSWNKRGHQTHWAIGDFASQFQFQLYRDPVPSPTWLPSLSVTVMETFPTGKYRNFNPSKKGTDAGGLGSWTTGAAFGASKMYYFGGHHFFIYRINLQCDFYHTPVHVKGFNAYGGGYGAKGTVDPGINTQLQFGFEYTLTQRWGLDLDLVGSWTSPNRFSGNPGILSDGSPASNRTFTAIQYSLAPAIEYDWSANMGIIAGVWFTVAGKNASKFTSGVIAFNYFK